MTKTRIILSSIAFTVFINSCASDDDPAEITPKIQLSDQEIMEGDDGTVTLNFVVELQEAVDTDVLVSYATDDGSAFQNLDYVMKSGSLTLPAGSMEATLSIEIMPDQIKEGNEVFRLKFEVDPGVTLQKSTVTITIVNDDSDLPYTTEDYSTPANYQGWTQSWADEFEAVTINGIWWTHEIGGGGWGNNELEYYTNGSENSRIEDGNLIIEARNDTWDGQHQYTSARMITKGKKSFGSSRTDIRARLPYGQGIWPALWMLGNSIDTKSWPACGEIDIMELIGKQPATSHATVHWGSDFANHKYTGNSYNLSDEIFHDRYHVFSIVRELNQIWFYVDDILIYQFSSKDLQGQPNPFNDDYFFIFNVAIGGNWPGNPDGTTVFPQRMEVDYIRVFEKE